MTKSKLRDAWIMARKAEGCRVVVCLSCGSLFAQPYGRGRIGMLCDRRVCILSYRWRRKYNRMPPDWLWAKWRAQHGDQQRERPTTSLRFQEAA